MAARTHVKGLKALEPVAKMRSHMAGTMLSRAFIAPPILRRDERNAACSYWSEKSLKSWCPVLGDHEKNAPVPSEKLGIEAFVSGGLDNMLPNGKLQESKVDLEEPPSHCLQCDSVAPGRPPAVVLPDTINTRDDRLVLTCLEGA